MTPTRHTEGYGQDERPDTEQLACLERSWCALRNSDPNDGSGAVAQVSVRTERALDKAPPLAGRAEPNGA